jgi:hypothetical protein
MIKIKKEKILILVLLILNSFLFSENIKITISAIGDIMAHDNLQYYALATPDGYGTLFENTKKVFLKDDLTIANLETPVNDDLPIESFPYFNAKSPLVYAIKNAGIDAVSLANNHSFDQGESGIISTLKYVKQSGLIFSGTGVTPEESKTPAIFEVKKLKIGFMSLTFFVNIIRFKETKNRPCINLALNEDKEKLAEFCEIIKNAKKKVDLMIVSYHCGEEYKSDPNPVVINIIKQLAESGADVLLCYHPHVLGKIEYYKTNDGRNALIAYSLGNFISGQSRIIPELNESNKWIYDSITTKTSEGIILQFDAVKNNDKTYVLSPRIMPIYNLSFNYKKNNYTYNGFYLDFMDRILKIDETKKNTDLENIKDIKKVVSYRLEVIKKYIGLPVVSSE